MAKRLTKKGKSPVDATDVVLGASAPSGYADDDDDVLLDSAAVSNYSGV